MSLSAGSRLGPYEIVEPIGKGGMGEVYRARDTKLNRQVAVKVLPDEFAADEERLARFEREAKLLASLNHSNIAGIFGLEDSEGVQALVLELVEGPTLAERIAHGTDTRSKKPSPSPSRSPTRSKRGTRRVSSTAISSPRTSRSKKTAPSKCWTTGWRKRSKVTLPTPWIRSFRIHRR